MPASSPSPPAKAKESQLLKVINSQADLYIKIGKILRLTSLSVLFAGSAAIVFAAITLVKIGIAKGLTISAAAAANAPVFLLFGKIAAAAAVILLIAEAMDSYFAAEFNLAKLTQYIATAACCLCVFGYAFFIAPQMEYLLPHLSSNASISNAFHGLHERSRVLFSGIILFAWLSLILPVCLEPKAKVIKAQNNKG